jgi:O-acetylserine/cysteine efflux transporter
VTHAYRPIAPLDFLQLVAVALIWGVNNVLARVALFELPPFLVVAARFTVVLVLIGWRIRPIPRAKWPAFALMLCCVGPVHFGVQFTGLHMAHDLAPMVVAMQLWAPASVLFAMLLLHEHASRLRLAGVALAFIGVAGMTFDPVVFAQGGALVLVAAAACAYGLGTVMVRWIGADMDVWSMQGWIALASAPSMIAATLLFEPQAAQAAAHASWFVWGAIVFAGIVSSIGANAMMFRLVQRYEVSRTTPYLLATPVISFTLAGLWLGDHITPRILLGAAVTMSGVALVALAERRFRAVTPAPADPS